MKVMQLTSVNIGQTQTAVEIMTGGPVNPPVHLRLAHSARIWPSAPWKADYSTSAIGCTTAKSYLKSQRRASHVAPLQRV